MLLLFRTSVNYLLLLWLLGKHAHAFGPQYGRYLLTPRRSESINLLFSHFVPFVDMQNQQAREQFYGFNQINQVFPNPGEFELSHGIKMNLTEMFKRYVDAMLERKDISLKEVLGKTEQYGQSVYVLSLITEIEIDGLVPKQIRKHAFDDLKFPTGWTGTPNPDSNPPHTSTSENPNITPKLKFIMLMDMWMPFFTLITLSSDKWFYKIGQGIANPDLHTDSLDQWSLLFIKQTCEIIQWYGRYKDYKITAPNGFCPNACRASICLNEPNTDGAQCDATGFGRYDYACKCLPSYKWSQPDLKKPGRCVIALDCATHCDAQYTKSCYEYNGKVTCICRSSHMGAKCKRKRNACKERFDVSAMPGDLACNVAEGGQCLPLDGTDEYACRCPKKFTANPIYFFTNCLGQQDMCDSTVCVQGDCMSSPNGAIVYCLCPEGAYGPRCEYSRGQWAQWGPWSTCSPNCGLKSLRTRLRTRDCLGKACRGGGGHLRISYCPRQPCPDEALARIGQTRLEDYSSVKLKLLEGHTSHYSKLAGAAAKVIVILFVGFTLFSVTILVLKVHCTD